MPESIISLADEQKLIAVREVPLKVYHGAIWRPRNGWIIQLNSNDTIEDRRFTLFHEGFHILAHCKVSPIFRKRGSTQGAFNELLADYFAVCILMPKEWVVEKWSEVKNVERMAEIFEAPKTAMWFRLRMLGLV